MSFGWLRLLLWEEGLALVEVLVGMCAGQERPGVLSASRGEYAALCEVLCCAVGLDVDHHWTVLVLSV